MEKKVGQRWKYKTELQEYIAEIIKETGMRSALNEPEFVVRILTVVKFSLAGVNRVGRVFITSASSEYWEYIPNQERIKNDTV